MSRLLPELMLRTSPFAEDGWAGAWTIFYWGWWMSWAPFVGMFIARISRGRTIREFVFGVLLAPTVIGSLWFTIFGDSGILRQRNDGDMLTADGAVDTNTTLFHLLDGLPLSTVTSVLAIAVVVFFFVTSSDSGSLVIDILSTGGDLETPKITRVYWSVLEGVAAAVLLLVGGSGSLTALQTASIATAVPFSIVLVLACVSMLKAFRYDVATTPRYLRVSSHGSGATTRQELLPTEEAPRKTSPQWHLCYLRRPCSLDRGIFRSRTLTSISCWQCTRCRRTPSTWIRQPVRSSTPVTEYSTIRSGAKSSILPNSRSQRRGTPRPAAATRPSNSASANERALSTVSTESRLLHD